MTKRETLNALLSDTLSRYEIVAYAQHELALLDRKVASSKKDSKVSQAQVDLIYNALAKYPNGIQIKALIKQELENDTSGILPDNVTSSYVSYRLGLLKKENRVANEVVKGVSLYKVVE